MKMERRYLTSFNKLFQERKCLSAIRFTILLISKRTSSKLYKVQFIIFSHEARVL